VTGNRGEGEEWRKRERGKEEVERSSNRMWDDKLAKKGPSGTGRGNDIA